MLDTPTEEPTGHVPETLEEKIALFLLAFPGTAISDIVNLTLTEYCKIIAAKKTYREGVARSANGKLYFATMSDYEDYIRTRH